MAGICVCSFSLIIGSCMFLTLFCAEFQQSLKKFNKDIIKTANTKALSEKDRSKMRNAFYDLIQFHAVIRQLSAIWCVFIGQERKFLIFFLFQYYCTQQFIRLTILSSSTFMNVVSILFMNSAVVWCVGLLGIQVVSTRFS